VPVAFLTPLNLNFLVKSSVKTNLLSESSTAPVMVTSPVPWKHAYGEPWSMLPLKKPLKNSLLANTNGEGVGLGETVGVGVTVGEAVGLAVGEAVGEAVGLAVGEAVGLAVGEAVGLAVGETVGLAVGETVGLAVGETVGLGVGVGF
jgi:hypothetical protein